MPRDGVGDLETDPCSMCSMEVPRDQLVKKSQSKMDGTFWELCQKEVNEEDDTAGDGSNKICEQCNVFHELNFSIDNTLTFSEDHFHWILVAILPSPITWIWIAALGKSIIYPCIAVGLGIFLLLFISFLFKTPDAKHMGPFQIAPQHHLQLLYIVQMIMNVMFYIAMIIWLLTHQSNIVYECHWENFDEDCDAPPSHCFLYLDFLGNAFIVYFCSIFINVACVRTLKKIECADENCKQCNSKKRKDKEQCKRRRDITANWQYGIYQIQSGLFGMLIGHDDDGKTQNYATFRAFQSNDEEERQFENWLNEDEVSIQKEINREKIIEGRIWKSVKKALHDVCILGTTPVREPGFGWYWCRKYCKCCSKGDGSSCFDLMRNESSKYAKMLLLWLGVWGFSCMYRKMLVFANKMSVSVPSK